jgi:hypothetical protein
MHNIERIGVLPNCKNSNRDDFLRTSYLVFMHNIEKKEVLKKSSLFECLQFNDSLILYHAQEFLNLPFEILNMLRRIFVSSEPPFYCACNFFFKAMCFFKSCSFTYL